MAQRYKIAVVGDWDSVMGFRALGLDTFACASAEDAKHTINDLAKEEYAVIYLTEQLAGQLTETIDKYKDSLKPAIILIPGKDGSLGIGRSQTQSLIERAVGADIL